MKLEINVPDGLSLNHCSNQCQFLGNKIAMNIYKCNLFNKPIQLDTNLIGLSSITDNHFFRCENCHRSEK